LIFFCCATLISLDICWATAQPSSPGFHACSQFQSSSSIAPSTRVPLLGISPSRALPLLAASSRALHSPGFLSLPRVFLSLVLFHGVPRAPPSHGARRWCSSPSATAPFSSPPGRPRPRPSALLPLAPARGVPMALGPCCSSRSAPPGPRLPALGSFLSTSPSIAPSLLRLAVRSVSPISSSFLWHWSPLPARLSQAPMASFFPELPHVAPLARISSLRSPWLPVAARPNSDPLRAHRTVSLDRPSFHGCSRGPSVGRAEPSSAMASCRRCPCFPCSHGDFPLEFLPVRAQPKFPVRAPWCPFVAARACSPAILLPRVRSACRHPPRIGCAVCVQLLSAASRVVRLPFVNPTWAPSVS
jgi:hypothetical protein